jgi:hypothetical protein
LVLNVDSSQKTDSSMKRVITESDAGVAASREPTARGRWALGSLALSMLLASLGVSIANIALPTLVEVFTASFQHVQWVIIAYLLPAGVSLPAGVRPQARR